MKKSLLAVGFIFCFLASAQSETENGGEIIKEWNWESGKLTEENKPLLHCKPDAFAIKISPSEKTPDGKRTLEINITSPPDDVAHAKQVSFACNQQMKSGDKFRISFWCKGSDKGSLSYSVIQGVSPWTPLAENTMRNIVINNEWQKISLEFMSSSDWSCPVRVPMIMPGKYPEGGSIFIGPVEFSKTRNFLPLSIGGQWKIFPGVKSSDMDIGKLTAVPTELPGEKDLVKAITAALNNNILDIASLAGYYKGKEEAILFNEFESASDGWMQAGAAADYWFEFYINGKAVYDTLKTGNLGNKYSPEEHVFNFPVKKGKNLIAVKVLSGSKGWLFAFGKVQFKKELTRFIKIEPSKEWKLMNLEEKPWKYYEPQRFEKILVKPGTALDISWMNSGTPAGLSGRVIINKDGATAFEKEPDKAVKLRSFNLVGFGGWNFMMWNADKKEIEEYAEQIRLRGYNMVRLHLLEKQILGFSGICRGPFTKLSDVKIPQSQEELPVDKAFVDRLDYFIAKLKERGIYLYMEGQFTSTGWTAASPWAVSEADMEKGFFPTGLYFRDDYKKNWEAGVSFLLGHVNPYTGMNLADDPVLACFLFFNEQDIQIPFLKDFTPHWQKYLSEKYGSIEKLTSAWGGKFGTDDFPAPLKSFEDIPQITDKLLKSGTLAGKDAASFLLKITGDMTDWYFATIKKTGYKGLVSMWDMYMRLIDIPARAKMPVVSMHTYHSHPGKRPLSEKDYKQLAQNNDALGSEVAFPAGSSLADGAYFSRVAVCRFFGRPFMITEYSHAGFNQYRHENGLFFGSYAALQGWDCLTPHANTVTLYNVPLHPFSFESAMHPISRASDLVTAFAWFRGDVKTAKSSVELTVTPEMPLSKNSLFAIGSDYGRLSMLTRIGNSYPSETLQPVRDFKPDIKITPKEFSGAGGSGSFYYAVTEFNSKDEVIKGLVKQLRDKNILDKNNITDPGKNIFQSETGELTLNTEKETLSVSTPRLEGAIIKADIPVSLNSLEIQKCTVPASITVVSLDKANELKYSKKLLLIFSTDAVNSGTVFSSEKKNCVIDYGEFPIVMRTGLLELSLKTGQQSVPDIYALNMDGTREEKVACTVNNGKLILKLDTGTLKYATPFFEIAFQ
jgi:hypothetical protein